MNRLQQSVFLISINVRLKNRAAGNFDAHIHYENDLYTIFYELMAGCASLSPDCYNPPIVFVQHVSWQRLLVGQNAQNICNNEYFMRPLNFCDSLLCALSFPIIAIHVLAVDLLHSHTYTHIVNIYRIKIREKE